MLNSSIYSIPNNFQIGDYTLCPHYNSQNQLVFYAAMRSPSLGIEFLIRADALNKFREGHNNYRGAANLFYINGKPSLYQIQMAAGDYWKRIKQAHKDAWSDPLYYLYLGHIFVSSTTNYKSTPLSPTRPSPTPKIKYTITTLRNSNVSNITIENMSQVEYKLDLSQKFNTQWEPIVGDPTKFKLPVGNKLYISVPLSSVDPKPSIYFYQSGEIMGKIRFHN
ncbi:hypothetical protein [Pedobacter frigiditerrae]|uniref:hypothetical protein n=1 Tax=Pedobacter frigiditerrae TaxID=2530452 RepID=UPI00292E8AD8|nr:hypothetical protein [Pedobacter frigiditerrae]